MKIRISGGVSGRPNINIQLVFVCLAFTIMVVLSYFFAARLVEKYMSANAKEVLTTADTEVTAKLREGEVSVVTMSFSLLNRLENHQSIWEIHQYLYEVVQQLKAANPDKFVSIYGIINDYFIDGSRWTPPAGYNAEDRPWYRNAMANRGKVVVSLPYGDARDGSKIIAVSMTLEGSEGEFYGVICYDMYWKDIAQYVTALKIAEEGYGILLGPDYTFLSHPEDSLLGRRMQSLSGTHVGIVRNLNGSPNLSLLRTRNFRREEVVTFFRTMDNGWILGVVTPRKIYYRDVFNMARILAGLGLVMSAVLCGILVKLNKDRLRSDEENRSKTSFLARMSHEIRTPMNSIIGVSDILMRKDVPPDILEYISIIKESGNTLISIINDILDFSKIESGRIQIEPREYFLASLVNDVINVIRVRAADKKLDFFVFVDTHIPEKLVGDDVRMGQILINLLNNAVKYTREGYIVLRVEMEEMDSRRIMLRFRVKDTGIGIKNEDMGGLFTDFTRMDTDRNRGIEGSGLGLPIAARLCEGMGGKINIETEYGKGSTFTVSLVQFAGNGRKTAWIDRPEQKRVLLYEDEPLDGNYAVEAFHTMGIDPVHVSRMEELLTMLQEGFDFAFVSSRRAAEVIQAPRNNRTKLVIMSELGDISRYGDTICILKPVYSITLANVLNGISSHRHPAEIQTSRFVAPDIRALIVDDLATNLKVAKELMAPYGMTVDTCLSGAEAVELVSQNRYDLVFMDHMMPGMDGLRATMNIRSIDKNNSYFHNLPVIMLTANVITGQQELFFKSGINDFLAKPIEVRKLAEILEKWIPPLQKILIERRTAAREPRTTANMARPGEALVESSQNEISPTETSPLETPPLFAIPGIDVEQGIANTGSSFSAYAEVLTVFRKDIVEKILLIKDSLKEDDLVNYTILVHAIKGAARSVGAGDMGAYAARLEEAGRANDRETIRTATGTFLEQLDCLGKDIDKALVLATVQTAEPQDQYDSDGYKDFKLPLLRKALEDMDIITINKIMIDYGRLSRNPKTKVLAESLKDDILSFEYEKAVKMIDTILGPM